MTSTVQEKTPVESDVEDLFDLDLQIDLETHDVLPTLGTATNLCDPTWNCDDDNMPTFVPPCVGVG